MPRFRQSERLRKRLEFDRVFKSGIRLDGRLFVLVAAANGREGDRLGLTVSRRVGGAVERNRAKRLLRESFRRLQRGAHPGADLVILAKPALAQASLSEVDREFRERVHRLARSAALRRPRPAPAG